jgi:two-component system, LuxR family, response regulator FixJ
MPSATVFIVDDDSSLRRSLERLLRLEGWPVRTFGSAEEFLEQCSSGVRGCLVADVHLGRMSGLELQAILARWPSALPVILTSGLDDGITEAEAARLGAFAYLKKPFDASELIESVKRGMESGASPHLS